MKKYFVLFLITITVHTQAIIINQRQLCDLELILSDGFAPLKGFMNKHDYDGVIEHMRLADGTLWPIPITLDITQTEIDTIKPGDTIPLKTPHFAIVAYMKVTDIWKPNKMKEAEYVYGTCNPDHPGVDYLLNHTHPYYIGGIIIKSTKLPYQKLHYDFPRLRKTPAELKHYFNQKGYDKIVAFQTRNPMHKAHYELAKRASQLCNAHVLIHPVVGITKPGDIDYFTRVRCYQQVLNYYPKDMASLSLLPLAMRMAGPREALWHAIIRKNYGATHFIIGRDHAGPGPDRDGNTFYDPYQAQELVQKYAEEIGITIVSFQEMIYVPDDQTYYPRNEVPPKKKIATISGTQFRTLLKAGKPIPEWFSFPEVVDELRKAYPCTQKQGFTLFLTGLPGAGKSTIADALAMKLKELQYRHVTLLDGDHVRTHLSQELTFSKEHRSQNVRRVGFVANEITKNGGIAICALIAPYDSDRHYNRMLIESSGGYIEIYVNTPISTCQKRDPKELYAKAHAGLITNFTGVNDPFEAPQSPDISIDTTMLCIDECVDTILDYLKQKNYV